MRESKKTEALSLGGKNNNSEKQDFKTKKCLSMECLLKSLHGLRSVFAGMCLGLHMHLSNTVRRGWFPVMCCPLIFRALIYLWFANSEL